jgi:hypothetical protein
MIKRLYLAWAVVGFVLPYLYFCSFLLTHGLDVGLLAEQLFANDISSFFAVDLIISALVFLVFLVRESRRLGIENWWIFVVATLAIGPSFSWPLFLYVREARVAGEA